MICFSRCTCFLFVLTISLNYHAYGKIFIRKHQSFSTLCDNLQYDDNATILLVLKQNQEADEFLLRSNVHVISAATSDISSYASYALAINLIYIRSKNYSSTLHYHQKVALTVNEPLNETPPFPLPLDNDARWNKVQYFIHQLSAGRKEVDWYVWLDADLAIIDFQFDFKDFINHTLSNNSDRDIHILMSKDKDSAQFVANTGCMMVRNSAWSLHFFQLWWNTYDRSGCCDQNALTWLYHRQLPSDIQEKMLFLSADAINTHFPSYLHHLPTNPILHLAGFSSLYRIQIFRSGLQDLCATIQSDCIGSNSNVCYYDRPLSPQLTLTLSTLQHEILNMHAYRLSALDKLISNLQHDMMMMMMMDNHIMENRKSNDNELMFHKQTILSYHHHLEDIMKYEDDERIFVQQYSKLSSQTQTQTQVEWELLEQVHLIRKMLYMQLSQINSHLNLSDCLQHAEDVLVVAPEKEGVRGGEGEVSKECKQYVASYQEMISFGIESIITSFARITSISSSSTTTTLGQEKHFQNDTIMIFDTLYHILEVLYDVHNSIDQVLLIFPFVTIIQAKFTYYQFKHHQFMAQWCSTSQRIIGKVSIVNNDESQVAVMIDKLLHKLGTHSLFPTNNTIVNAATILQTSSTDHNKMVYEAMIAGYHLNWLRKARDSWEHMVSKYQYYGTNYVLADPEKEYIFLLFELGITYCEQTEYDAGVDTLFLAIERQKHMIEGYLDLQITTDDIVRQGKIVLSELYFNVGYCLYQQQQSEQPNYHEYNEKMKTSESMLSESVRLLQACQAQHETRAYRMALKYLEEIRIKSYTSSDLLQQTPHPILTKTTKKFKKRKKPVH